MSEELTNEQLLAKAQAEGYIRFTGEGKNERIVYIHSKEHSERWSDPEEKVRAAFYAELIFRYEYPARRMEIERTVPRRTPSDLADIVIYGDDEWTKPFIVIECKRDGISQAEFLQSIEQACGNCSSLKAKFAGAVAGGTRRFLDFRGGIGSLEREKNIVSDIPTNYGAPPPYRFFKGVKHNDLKPVSRDDLRSAIRKCHQTLWEGGKRSAIVAFGEFSKIIFIKIRDEMNKNHKKGDAYDFQRKTGETADELAARIHALYDAEKLREPDVFTENIKAGNRILAQVVEHIEHINFNKTDLDTKGVAFEEFMGGFFKGDFGQYFTPREIIAFCVQMIQPTVNDFVLDPACGSGGFLLYSLDYIRDLAAKQYPNHETDLDEGKEHYRYWHDFAEKQLFGLEIDEELSRVAKMNMIIHDDGHTNIIGSDALDFLKNIALKKPRLHENGFDIVLTNPPFGSVVKQAEQEENFLDQFELRKYLNKSTTGVDSDESASIEQSAKRGAKSVKLRASVKTEILFLERIFDFLKADGKSAVVLPDGILTNATLQGVRDWLMEKFQILAVVSLPQFAFSHYDAGVKASVLFLRKRRDNEKPSDDEAIFMAQADNIGYDATGRKSFKTEVREVVEKKHKIEIQSCDFFDYKVEYEWSELDPKKPSWSEKRREVIPATGIVAEFHKFQKNNAPFFV